MPGLATFRLQIDPPSSRIAIPYHKSRMYPSILSSILSFFRIRPLHQRLFGSCWNSIPKPLPRNSSSSKASESCTPNPGPIPTRFEAAFRNPTSSLYTRTSLLSSRPQEQGLLGLIALRKISWSRPLHIVESQLLKSSSLLLPSVLNTLKSGESINKTTPGSALLLTGLFNGEFSGSSPSDLITQLQGFQEVINKRFDDLKMLCCQLKNMEVSASLHYVDGKTAIVTSSERVMEAAVVPLMQKLLPWNDSWNINVFENENKSVSDLSETPEFIPEEALPASGAVSESFYDCKETGFSEVSLRDLLPNATQDELEVFTTWSQA